MVKHGFFCLLLNLFLVYLLYKLNNMKIVIKEMTELGDKLLVYQMTDTNQSISCAITNKEDVNEVIESISNKIRLSEASLSPIVMSYVLYHKYIKQDGITE